LHARWLTVRLSRTGFNPKNGRRDKFQNMLHANPTPRITCGVSLKASQKVKCQGHNPQGLNELEMHYNQIISALGFQPSISLLDHIHQELAQLNVKG